MHLQPHRPLPLLIPRTRSPSRVRWGRPPAWWLVRQAAAVAFGVFGYFLVRGHTEGARDVALAHAAQVEGLEERLGIALEPQLQAWVAPSESLRTMANWVYIWGHWPVITVTMIWLAWHHRELFLRLRDAMLVSGALGLVVFVTYPLAPPRLANLGMVDTITDHSQSYRVLQPPAFTNQYAAMPSLHSGWDLLVGMAIFSAASTLTLRVIGFVLPVLMGLAVVATANHYVLDVAAGVILALLGDAVARRAEQHRHRRRRLTQQAEP